MAPSKIFESNNRVDVLRALRFRSEISGILRISTTEKELCQKVCSIAVSTAGYRMAWIGKLDFSPDKWVIPVCYAGEGTDYLNSIKISWGEGEFAQGPTGTAIREVHAVFTRDFATDPLVKPWSYEGLKRGFYSAIALPLVIDAQVIGSFSLYRNEKGIFSEDEVELMNEVAMDISFAISALRLREQNEKALKDLEDANRLKLQFLDIAAHELRTPITTFSLMIQMCKMQLKKGIPTEIAMFDRILVQVDRLTNLVNDLLDTTKLERGLIELRLSQTDLVILVNESIQHFKMLYPNREFHFVHPDHPILLKIDALRIEQVVTNLIDNAHKYSTVEKSIEIKIEEAADSVKLLVTDQGAGITKDKLDLIFLRFYRIKSDETILHSGLGLGLFICKSIIELHHGKIGVESELSQGSTFYFELPKNIK